MHDPADSPQVEVGAASDRAVLPTFESDRWFWDTAHGLSNEPDRRRWTALIPIARWNHAFPPWEVERIARHAAADFGQVRAVDVTSLFVAISTATDSAISRESAAGLAKLYQARMDRTARSLVNKPIPIDTVVASAQTLISSLKGELATIAPLLTESDDGPSDEELRILAADLELLDQCYSETDYFLKAGIPTEDLEEELLSLCRSLRQVEGHLVGMSSHGRPLYIGHSLETMGHEMGRGGTSPAQMSDPDEAGIPIDNVATLAEAWAVVLAQRSELEAREQEIVEGARAGGLSWGAIGEAIGLSRQAAYRRYDKRGREAQKAYNASFTQRYQRVTVERDGREAGGAS